jgi:hypothetical protein
MSKFCIAGATALSLALAVATPAFAAELGGGGMHIGGFRGARASISSVSASDAAGAQCAQRWAYYNRESGTYMDDDGQWLPCR